MSKLKKYILLIGIILILSYSALSFTFLSSNTTNINQDSKLLMNIGSSSSDPLWNVTWGGDNTEDGNDIVVDNSGNVICTGETYSAGDVSGDIFLVKYDSTGNKLWEKYWKGNSYETAKGVDVDDDGNIYVCGITNSIGGGLDDLLLIKYNANGDKIKETTVGGAYNDRGNDVVVDNSGNIYCIGSTYNEVIKSFNILLVKFSSDLTVEWNKTWGGSSSDFGEGIALDHSGNIYCTGYTYSYGAGGRDFVVIKFDSNGNKQWNTTWGGSGYDSAYKIDVDSDGYIYCVGETETSDMSAGAEDLILVKFDENGNPLWNSTCGGSGNDWGKDLTIAPNGNIYCIGSSNTFNNGNYHDFLLAGFKNTTGELIWNSTWGYLPSEPLYDYGYGIDSDSSGKLYLVGSTYNENEDFRDVAILVYDSNSLNNSGSSSESETGDEPGSNSNISGYPYTIVFIVLGIGIVLKRSNKLMKKK